MTATEDAIRARERAHHAPPPKPRKEPKGVKPVEPDGEPEAAPVQEAEAEEVAE